MSTITLEAQPRTSIGTGANRRLRRLQNQVPAVIYGGHKDPENILFDHLKMLHLLENELIFSSVLDLKIKNHVEQVILKSLQRHPYKAQILHMDFQRVSAKDILVKHVPIHFIGEDQAPGLHEGGLFNHHMTQIEVRCAVKDLPPFIEVNVSALKLDDVIHLSQLTLPAKVTLTADTSDANHDLPVVSVHLPRVSKAEIEAEAEEAAQHEAAAAETHAESAPEAHEEALSTEEAPPADDASSEA